MEKPRQPPSCRAALLFPYPFVKTSVPRIRALVLDVSEKNEVPMRGLRNAAIISLFVPAFAGI